MLTVRPRLQARESLKFHSLSGFTRSVRPLSREQDQLGSQWDATGPLPRSGWESSPGPVNSHFLAQVQVFRALFISDCVAFKMGFKATHLQLSLHLERSHHSHLLHRFQKEMPTRRWATVKHGNCLSALKLVRHRSHFPP